jgi:hypothetical protein
MQWGRWKAGTYSSSVTITYPIAFRNANYAIAGVGTQGGGHLNDHFTVGSLTATGCRLITGYNGKDEQAQNCGIIVCGL